MGHQDYFLAPLPGSVALLVSELVRKSFTVSAVFTFACLFSSIMESFTAGYMFGNDAQITPVVERSSPITEIAHLKYLLALLIVLWITVMLVMELSIPVSTCFILNNYVSCLRLQVCPEIYS